MFGEFRASVEGESILAGAQVGVGLDPTPGDGVPLALIKALAGPRRRR